MISKAISILTGRTQHWAKYNNSHVSMLLRNAESLHPTIKPPLLQFIASSHFIINELIGPTKGDNRIIKKELKSITSSEFRDLHGITIWTLISVFNRQTCRAKDLSALMILSTINLIGLNEQEKFISKLISSEPNIDISLICNELFNEYSRILHCDSENSICDSLGRLSLTMHFSNHYEASIKSLTKINYLQ
jgi:hypothetical protein